jgi:ubiquinone/menaquinone biosynthesis C-methylase UbiE
MAVTELDEAKVGAFAERLFGAALSSIDLVTVYVGDRLGLYKALADGGSMTSDELAKATGIHPRYAREWCEQQAVTGILDLDDATAAPDARVFTLSAEHAFALTDPDSPASIAPIARAVVSCVAVMPQLLDAYRTGGGVPWSAFGADGIESQGDFNRPWLRTALAQEYLASIPDVAAKLEGGARVGDIACGVGWAGISIAKHYPSATVVGLDPDESSIALARRFAAEDGVADRTTFEVHDATQPLPGGPYDLVVVIEAIHDMAHPVDVLTRIRESLVPGGTVIVADEKVAESFTAPGDEIERFMYGASMLICLPAGMSEEHSACTGTVMRPDTFRSYATAAGFEKVDVLEQIDHPMLRFYRLYA